jgi:hypothetical protein
MELHAVNLLFCVFNAFGEISDARDDFKASWNIDDTIAVRQ